LSEFHLAGFGLWSGRNAISAAYEQFGAIWALLMHAHRGETKLCHIKFVTQIVWLV